MKSNTKKPMKWDLIAQSQAPHFNGNRAILADSSLAHVNHRVDRLERQFKAFALKVANILDTLHQTERGD